MLRHRGTGRSAPYSHNASTDDDVLSLRKKRSRWDRSWGRFGTTTASLWNIRRFRIHLRYVVGGLGGVCIILFCLFLLFEEPLGAQVDAYLRQRYYLYILRQQQQHYTYPDVLVKATRKVECNHYSYYLYELFRRREQQSSSSIEPTIPAVAETQSQQSRNKKRCFTLVRWICQRCLRSGFRGSLARCPSFCSTCSYHGTGKSITPSSSQIPSDLRSILRLPQNNDSSRIRNRIGNLTIIPRKIHQVGKTLIRSLEYPEVGRLQSTWRTLSGYEYYFYTAEDQVAFLKEEYDSVVLQMYQSFARHSREEQEHLFAMLVLYRLGGIYADNNVQWQLPLDALVQKDEFNQLSPPSLILPRHPHLLQRHCLYNGWIAATPRHPVLAQLILQALQYFNATLPLQAPTSADEPIWKWHVAETESYRYGGACALGYTVNSVLQRDTTADFDRLGHYHIPKKMSNSTISVEVKEDSVAWGPILILMMSERDTGATRITDLERNFLVATVHQGLDLRTIQERARSSKRRRQ